MLRICPVDAQKSSDFTVEQVGQEALCLILPTKYEAQPLTEQLLIELGLISHPDAKALFVVILFLKVSHHFLLHSGLENIPITGKVNQINQILLPVAKGLRIYCAYHKVLLIALMNRKL